MSHNFFGATRFGFSTKKNFNENLSKILFATPLVAAVFVLNLSSVNAAELRGSQVTLCNNAYSTNGTSCTPYVPDSCASGFYHIITADDTVSPLFNERCVTSTTKVSLSSEFYPIYTGMLVGSTVTLCDNNGFSTDGSTCTTHTQGNCGNGFYTANGTKTTFNPLFNDRCVTSTKKVTILSDMYPIYNGMLMGSAVTLCDAGYSTNGSACTSYANSTCPGGLTDIPTHTNTFAVKSGACASNYKTFSAEELCTYTPTGSYCVNPCGAGSLYTSVNTCATPCASGATTFNTSTGLAVPLWTTAQTTPALNVELGEDVCYVNLVPGAAGVGEHAVMVQYDGNTYHTAE